MFFYLAIAVILFYFSFIDFNKSKLYENFSLKELSCCLIFITVFFLIFLGGFRWNTGTDWPQYYYFFKDNYSLDSFFSIGFEPGFSLFNFFIKHFTDSYTIYLLIFHFFVIVPKIYFIKKISYYPLVSIILYWCIYIGDVVAVRNSLAVSFLLLSIFSIKKRNIKQFLLLTALATSIHYSCILWFLSYHIYYLDISKKKWIKLFIYASILAIFGKYLYPQIIKKILSPFKNPFIAKIIYYAAEYKEPVSSPLSMILSLTKRLIFLPFLFIFYKRLIKISTYNKGLINLFLFGNIVYLAFFSGFTQMGRCVITNIYLEIILLPEFICCIKKKYIKILFIFLILFYGLFKMIWAIRPFSNVLIPYNLIFDY